MHNCPSILPLPACVKIGITGTKNGHHARHIVSDGRLSKIEIFCHGIT